MASQKSPDTLITRELIDNTPDIELRALLDKLLQEYQDNTIVKELVDESQIYADVMAASRGKKHRQSVQRVLGNAYSNIFEFEDTRLMKTIRNIQFMILQDSIDVQFHNTMLVPKENHPGEFREIVLPNFAKETILHHALMRVLIPAFQKSFYYYSCGSIPGKGVNFVRHNITRALKNDPKNTKYGLKLDIHSFFNSIPHRILKKRLRLVVHDELLRSILFKIIDITEKGLPLGFFTSNWLANFYLTPLDHYIKERILDDCGVNTERTGRHGAVYYYRYVDDMLILGPNKKELHIIKNKLDEVLAKEYGLELRADWQVFKISTTNKKTGETVGRPFDFVGFRFYRDKVVLRKHTYKKCLRLIRHLKRVGIEKITAKEALSMISYYGIIYWTNATGIYTKLLRPWIKLKDLKKIVKAEMRGRIKMAVIE